jgi:hypothetical protein
LNRSAAVMLRLNPVLAVLAMKADVDLIAGSFDK